MNILLDPNVAFLILVLGVFLAILALFSPGTGLIELGAASAIVISGYAIYNLPINLWALIVLVVGVFPFILAVRKSRNWIYLVLSMIALVIGSVFLFRTDTGGAAVNPIFAAITLVVVVGLLWVVARKGLEAIQLRPTLLQSVVGMIGEAKTRIYDEGSVYVGGENWSARSAKPIRQGARVRVISKEGFILEVEEVEG